MADEDAVFVLEGDNVGHGGEGDEVHGLEEELSEVGRGAFAVAEGLADLPGELEGDAGAAEVGEGVIRAGQPGVDDDVGLGQPGPARGGR